MRYIKSYSNTTDLRTDLDYGELDHPYVAKVNGTIDFNSITTDWNKEYFTIKALTDGTISYSHKEGSNPMFYSINEGEWIETTVSVDITVSKNDMIRFKSNRGNQAYNQETFTSEGTAQFAVAGNIMSLVAGDDFATYVPNTNAAGTDGDLYRSFKNFFGYCTGLASAKNLIIKYCDNESFSQFFNGCTNLQIPPKLPATTLAEACYQYMFKGCTSLKTAPELPATALANYCYSNMFQGCTSLTTAPELPATTLKTYCYGYMFNGCTSLTTAPALPARDLADACYGGMFGNTNVLPDCSNIDFASSIVIASGGLKGLFSGTKVTDNDLERLLPKNDNGRYYLPATTLANYCYQEMFQGCTSLTTAPILPATTLADSCYSNMFNGCSSLTTAPELPATTLKTYCYYYMFCNCTKLTQAPELPATALADSCYCGMFSNTNVLPDCSNIDFASSTVVASGGLKGLFSGTKVTDNDLERLLPKNDNGKYYLPATTLAGWCYQSMFMSCTNLTTAPALPATTLADSCYRWMFYGCTSLTQAPALPATTLANNCYDFMFCNCTKLTQAPELPASALARSCYQHMFMGCSSLNYIKCLATDISATFCTDYWVLGVAATGTFVKNPNTTWETGNNGIPSGWTVVNNS